MPQRMKSGTMSREFMKAQLQLTMAAKKGLGDPVLTELVVLRASQLNHCAFCIDMHARNLAQAGESPERIALLNAWEEAAEHFTERERAALALTEAVTVLTDGFVPDEVYAHAAAHFTESELAHLLSVIVAINNWNRVNATLRMPPGELP
jgi:AhpD family alkylhydroperoxidase